MILVPKHHRIVSQNIPWMSEYFISLTKHVMNVTGPWDISVTLVNTFFQKFESAIDLFRCLVDDEQPYAKISSLFLQPKVFCGAFTSITNERCFFYLLIFGFRVYLLRYGSNHRIQYMDNWKMRDVEFREPTENARVRPTPWKWSCISNRQNINVDDKAKLFCVERQKLEKLQSDFQRNCGSFLI